MLKRIPILVRLTALCILTLTACCIGLTIILNVSANEMANVIEAIPVTPAYQVPLDHGEILPASPAIQLDLKDTTVARRNFLYECIIYVIMIIFVGGVLTYITAKRAITPLKELSYQMKNRTVHNLSEELPIPKAKDELSELTISFNEMSKKLEGAFAMQKRFSQSAAHELRTPLAVLRTKIDVFAKHETHTPAEYDKLIGVIASNTDRLSNLVGELLDFSNMDSFEIDEQVDLSEVAVEVISELSQLAAKKNITVTHKGSATLNGNRELVFRALYNVVENGIKYGVDGGVVTIKIEYDETGISLAVCDDGIGIDAKIRELIFEPFYRADKSRSRKIGGAGLGLATAKAIIERHCGDIICCEREGGGTSFEITFPTTQT